MLTPKNAYPKRIRKRNRRFFIQSQGKRNLCEGPFYCLRLGYFCRILGLVSIISASAAKSSPMRQLWRKLGTDLADLAALQLKNDTSEPD